VFSVVAPGKLGYCRVISLFVAAAAPS